MRYWLDGEDSYDRAALEEWLDESRGFRETLPEMVADYAPSRADAGCAAAEPEAPDDADSGWAGAIDVAIKREDIREHLRALGIPPTKMYAGQLPLFPDLSIASKFGSTTPRTAPIIWDSEFALPGERRSQVTATTRCRPAPASVHVLYQLHAYNKRQRIEQEHQPAAAAAEPPGGGATVLVAVWIVLVQRRERQRALAQQQVDLAERKCSEEDRRHEETERKLLEQRLATQAAEQQALELKSQLYASIGIMAGSYAHNIKNLLVRPNDLLRRCLEADGLSPRPGRDAARGPADARHRDGATAADPADGAPRPQPHGADGLDLNAVLRDLERTWHDLARDRRSWTWRWSWTRPAPAVGGRRLFASATGGGEPAVQRPRRHVRDAQPPPRRRPQATRRWTRRPGDRR